LKLGIKHISRLCKSQYNNKYDDDDDVAFLANEGGSVRMVAHVEIAYANDKDAGLRTKSDQLL